LWCCGLDMGGSGRVVVAECWCMDVLRTPVVGMSRVWGGLSDGSRV
jgi:hypothetical protein